MFNIQSLILNWLSGEEEIENRVEKERIQKASMWQRESYILSYLPAIVVKLADGYSMKKQDYSVITRTRLVI